MPRFLKWSLSSGFPAKTHTHHVSSPAPPLSYQRTQISAVQYKSQSFPARYILQSPVSPASQNHLSTPPHYHCNVYPAVCCEVRPHT